LGCRITVKAETVSSVTNAAIQSASNDFVISPVIVTEFELELGSVGESSSQPIKNIATNKKELSYILKYI